MTPLFRGAAALLVVLAACGGGGASTAKVPEVVAGGASTWQGLKVIAGTTSAEVPTDSRAKLTPLLASREFDRPLPLSEYGLDHPQAALTYTGRAGATATVDVGQANFDRHFLYVQRRGRPIVYLVPADTLRPVLALAGIEIKPPE